jgi:hypothetical protein
MPDVSLSDKELRLLLQSLQHCIDTCQQTAAGGGPCEDCQAARELLARLTALSTKRTGA